MIAIGSGGKILIWTLESTKSPKEIRKGYGYGEIEKKVKTSPLLGEYLEGKLRGWSVISTARVGWGLSLVWFMDNKMDWRRSRVICHQLVLE